MKRATPHATRFDSVKGKVAVVCGGARGIGAATVERLFHNRAHVVFGDTDGVAGAGLVERLEALGGEHGDITFVQCDVTRRIDVYNLFKIAYDKHGGVDHAFELTGIPDSVESFDSKLTIESAEHVEGINAEGIRADWEGIASFTRIAIVFLRNNKTKKGNRSLTLTGRINSMRDLLGPYERSFEIPGTIHYVRSLGTGKTIYENEGIRVNCICPRKTESLISTSTIDTLCPDGHPQTEDDCARFYLGAANDPSMTRKAIYVEGGKGWEDDVEFGVVLPQSMPRSRGNELTWLLRENIAAIDHVR